MKQECMLGELAYPDLAPVIALIPGLQNPEIAAL